MMKVITVAAAIILNERQQLLVVRKKNTTCFMQVGGKLAPNESAEQALLREVQEEIACSAQIQHFVGRFETATANESDHQLVAYLYLVNITQPVYIGAEIEQMAWIDLNGQQRLTLAPLTTEVVIPWVQDYLAAKY